MPALLRSSAVLVFLLTASAALAQPQFFGEPFPLTGTRYGAARGYSPLLLSNGRDPVVFWADGFHIRVTRVVNGEAGVSRPLIALDGFDGTFDAVWTGTHFLVVAAGLTDIKGRLLDAFGEPLGQPFHIVDGWTPRIAFNGRHALMLYRVNTADVMALLLTPNGEPAEAPYSLGITYQGRAALTSNGSGFAALVPQYLDPYVLLFDANGRVTSKSTISADSTGLSIASDGHRYLAVGACGEGGGACGPVFARIIEPDGSFGNRLELDPSFLRAPEVVWTGSKWVVASVHEPTASQPESTIRIVQVDGDARVVEQRRQTRGAETSLAVFGGQVFAAWGGGRQFRDTIFFGDVPLGGTHAVEVSKKEKAQTLLATASSDHGVLVVWQEIGDRQTTVHTGFRARDGRWTERRIFVMPPTQNCFYCYEPGMERDRREQRRGLPAADERHHRPGHPEARRARRTGRSTHRDA